MSDRLTAKDAAGAECVLRLAMEHGPSARRKKGIPRGDEDKAYPRDKDLGFGLPAPDTEAAALGDAEAP